jgi:hypothetical protein
VKSAPVRLLEADGVTGVLRRDLLAVRDADAGFDVATQGARFDAAAAAMPATAPTAAGAKIAWSLGAVGAGGALVAGLLAGVPEDRRPPPVATPVAAAQELPTALAPVSLVAPIPATAESHPPVVPTPRPAKAVVAPTERASRRRPEAPGLAEEMRATAAARDALERRPAEALRLVRAARRDFPRGVFAEERDALEVLALAALGRHTDADARGAAFLARYPRGPFSERIRRALQPG